MADAVQRLDSGRFEEIRPRYEALLTRLRTVQPIEFATDPLDFAAEAATLAVADALVDEPIATAVLRLVHRGATPFERGLAMGMALMLASEPARD